MRPKVSQLLNNFDDFPVLWILKMGLAILCTVALIQLKKIDLFVVLPRTQENTVLTMNYFNLLHSGALLIQEPSMFAS